MSAMQERIEKELALLRRPYPDLEYQPDGRWVRIPEYPLPPGWRRGVTDVAFDIPSAFPSGPPYGIYVPAELTFNGQRPRELYGTLVQTAAVRRDVGAPVLDDG